MNYRIEQCEKRWIVKEKATDHIVGYFKSREQARKQNRFLNLGGGFDGWTPEFVIRGLK